MSIEETPLDEMIGLTDAEIESMADEVEDDDEVVNEPAKADVEEATDDEGEVEEEEDPEPAKPEPVAAPDLFVPEYKATVPETIAENYKQLDTSYEELSTELSDKYEIGELTFTEYQKESRDLNARYNNEIRKLDTARLKAEISQEQNQQTQEQKWQWEQDAFFKDHADFKFDPILFGALDATLKSMYADPSNGGKSGLQLLNEAGAKVAERFSGINPAPTNERPKPPSSKKPMPDLPTTLSNIPAAETNTEANNEFDHLDTLGGLEYEAAVAKLTDEQRVRFFK
jgi:hypothetical protein